MPTTCAVTLSLDSLIC